MKPVQNDDPRYQRKRIADALERIRAILDARLPKPPRVFPYHIAVTELHIRKDTSMPVNSGNHFFDQVKVQIVLAPNGILDSPPTWTIDDPSCSLEVAPDGLSGIVSATSDVPVWNVFISAPADNPSTPDLELVTATVSGSFSHSKATDLGVTVTEIPL